MLTLVAHLELDPGRQQAGAELDVDELVETAPSFEEARAAIRARVPAGWRIAWLRTGL